MQPINGYFERGFSFLENIYGGWLGLESLDKQVDLARESRLVEAAIQSNQAPAPEARNVLGRSFTTTDILLLVGIGGVGLWAARKYL